MDTVLQDQLKCNVKLLNKDLWDSFYNLNTEMIITKPGRRMFPSMRVQIQDLNPNKTYTLLVEMVPVTKCRYRYSAATGWAPAGAEEAHSPNRFYIHPESPAPGHHWMSQAVSFGRLKLTNTANPPAGHIVMASMHKYQPRIHIVECSDHRGLDYSPKTIVNFPETQFIAVTAYQNDRMTKMKIDHNPFAKGFRETGQSKCKRKRMRMEQARLEKEKKKEVQQKECEESGCESDSGELIVVVDDDQEQQIAESKRIALSPATSSASSASSTHNDSGLSDCDSSYLPPCSPNYYYQQQQQQMMGPQFYNPFMVSALYHQYQQQFVTASYGSYLGWNPFVCLPSPSIESSSSSIRSASPQDLSQKNLKANLNSKADNVPSPAFNLVVKDQDGKEVKFTDFSIRAITGC